MKYKKTYKNLKKRNSDYLKRRPHRAFRLTKRRDYKRSLELPGYISFTKYVVKTILENRKTFFGLAAVYALATLVVVGLASQTSYDSIRSILNITSGNIGAFGKAGVLFVSTVTGGLSQGSSDVQNLYAVVITLLTWLTSIWLLRNFLAGHKVKLRDGLYNAGAPILSTSIITVIILFQMIPIAIALIAFSAANATGLLANGAQAVVFWFVIGLLVTMSIYWITSTFFALVIVTLPGMYPFAAIKASGDLVVGRRLRIIYRMAWAVLLTLLLWAIIMIPIIMLDDWLKGIWKAISWFPTVPIVLLMLSSVTIIFMSAYTYLLYRKVVADDVKPK